MFILLLFIITLIVDFIKSSLSPNYEKVSKLAQTGFSSFEENLAQDFVRFLLENGKKCLLTSVTCQRVDWVNYIFPYPRAPNIYLQKQLRRNLHPVGHEKWKSCTDAIFQNHQREAQPIVISSQGPSFVLEIP